MIDLDAIRARAEVSAKARAGEGTGRDNLTLDQVCSRWYSSAQDVPDLLELIQAQQYTTEHEREQNKALKDAVRILVVAARNWAHSEGDKDTLEALVAAVDMLPWTVLDDLGIGRDDDE